MEQLVNKLRSSFRCKFNDSICFSEIFAFDKIKKGVDDYPVANPLWNARMNNWDKATGFGFTNNFIFEWFVTEDLRLRAKFGLTKQDDDEQTRLSPMHSQFDDRGETEKGVRAVIFFAFPSPVGVLVL